MAGELDDKFLGKFRGFLFKNIFKKKDSHPAMTGRFSFTKDQIRRLVERARGKDEQAEINCEAAAFEKLDRNGDRYLFVSVDCDKEPPARGVAADDRASKPAAASDDIPF